MKKFLSVVLVLALSLSLCAAAAEQPVVISAPAARSPSVNVIKAETEAYEINVFSPSFEGFSGAETLNRFADDLVADGVGALNRAVLENKTYTEERAKQGDTVELPSCALFITFDYWESGDILSLTMLTYLFSGGAHGMTYKNAVTVNTKTGEIYALKDLFKDWGSYQKTLTDMILARIGANPEMYFESAADDVREHDYDYEFYLDAGKLAVFFPLYEIAPYAAGIIHFYFDGETLKAAIRDEVSGALAGAPAVPAIRIQNNGKDLAFDSSRYPYMQEYHAMVPLRLIAETLGYEVGWTAETGALVAGGQIREGADNYYTSSKPPVKLGAAAKVINGVTFVPVEYFSEVLGENVSYYDDAVRMYQKSGKANQFYALIREYALPASAEECAKAYALALKMRNGAEQYALLNDSLRTGKRAELEALNWVTGTSSPWIKSYDVKKLAENKFEITVYWQTSTGPAGSEVLKISTEETGAGYSISAIS